MTTSDAYTHGPGSPGTGQHSGDAGNQGLIDQLQSAAGTVADQASSTAGAVAGQAKDQMGSQLDDQRQRFAGTLGSAAGALRQTSQQLRSDDQGNVATLVDRAAERLDRFSRYLGERSLDDLVNDVERFGRNEPGLFLTAAFGAGLFAARFLKSASPRPRTSTLRGRSTSGRYQGMSSNAGSAAFSQDRRSSFAGEGQASAGAAYAGTASGRSTEANGHSGQPNWTENAGGQ